MDFKFPHGKVVATLLIEMWLRQESDCNQFGGGDSPLYLWV